jgi:hypothetical protein
LENVGRKKSEMNDIDCYQLKRNFAWLLFSSVSLTYAKFCNSVMSPVLHQFNNHSKCCTWCRHRSKSQELVDQLEKYRYKEKDNQLYLQCVESIERFMSKEHLQECHHKISSQNNEPINKSIMRYVPKDKTYCKTMPLTSRSSLAVSIDTVGHSEYFVRMFCVMKV